MPDIALLFDRRMYEYDIYTLVKAFYPEASIYLNPDDLPGTADISFQIEYGENPTKITVGVFDKDTSKASEKVYFLENFRYDDAASDKLPGKPKNILKRFVYDILSELSGKELPWGTLTGIRPVKLATAMIEGGADFEEATVSLQREYYVSDEKAKLCVNTALREKRELLGLDYADGYSLYVGIPFCPSICLYCTFSSSLISVWRDRIDDYLGALIKELDYISKKCSKKRLQSIYIGGGTPSSLSDIHIRKLLDAIESRFDMSSLCEYTFEAGRADSITREKLSVIRDSRVSRICINPQTMNQSTLDLIGRQCSVSQVYKSYELARSMGFDDINMDIIIGLPGEDTPMVKHTLDEIKRMSPDSLTAHCLALKRASRLKSMWEEYKDMLGGDSTQMMDATYETAKSMDMSPYYLYRQKNISGNFENVGFAKDGKASLYNILMMEEKQSIFAVGAGASTKFVWPDSGAITRAENVKDVRLYIERIDEMIERKEKSLMLGGDSIGRRHT